MYTVKEILDRSVSNWSKILGCSDKKTTTTKPRKKKKVSKKQ
jgi:hypothetical protein